MGKAQENERNMKHGEDQLVAETTKNKMSRLSGKMVTFQVRETPSRPNNIHSQKWMSGMQRLCDRPAIEMDTE